jgi:hypothetical protein
MALKIVTVDFTAPMAAALLGVYFLFAVTNDGTPPLTSHRG